jgi:nucleoside-diphosphate-sugar epimerase
VFPQDAETLNQGKRVAEALTYGYQRQDGVDVRVARIFNTFGTFYPCEIMILTFILFIYLETLQARAWHPMTAG